MICYWWLKRELEVDCVKQCIDMLKQTINIWKIKIKKKSYLMYLDANNLHGWGMSENLPVDGFKWVKDLSQFNEDFTKKYDKNSNKGYFLEADAEYPKKLFNLHKGLPFLSERKKIK